MFAFAVSTRENAAAGRSCSARLACATRPLWSGPCISRRASYASPRLRRPRSMKFKTLHRLHTLTLLAPNPSESVCAHSSLARYTPGLSLRFMSTMYNLIWTYQKALPYSRKHGVPPSRPGCWVYPDMLEVGIGLGLNTTESRTHFVRTYLSSNCVFARVLLGNFRESFDGCVSLRRLTTGSVGCHVRTACDRLRPRKRNFVQRALPYHRQQACAER